jgi:branched-chain amino acid transport system permease protein
MMSFLARRNTRVGAIGLLVGLALAVVIPFLPGIGQGSGLFALTACAIYSLAALAAGILYGRLGLVSLMQIALVAVGGWVTLRLYYATDLPFELVAVAAAVVTALIGTLLSLPALKLSGLSLAIVTLMIAGGIQVVITATGFPNGGTGFLGRLPAGTVPDTMPRPTWGASDDAYFRYVAVVVAIVFLAVWWLLSSRVGRAWAAIRQGEAGAITLGIPVTRYRILALLITSFITGLSGALLAANTGVLDSTGTTFSAQQSVLLFATVLIGGTFSLSGAVIGGIFFYGVPVLLQAWGVSGDLVFIILGLGTIQAITTNPIGIAGSVAALARRWRTPRRASRAREVTA